MSGFKNVILCCLIGFLNSPLSTADNPDKLSKRQTDSFVVQANYGVQSDHLTTESPEIQTDYNVPKHQENITEHESLPTPDAWIGSNNFLPSPYTNNYQGHLKTINPPVSVNEPPQLYKGLSYFRTDKKAPLQNVVYGSTTPFSTQITPDKRHDTLQDVHSVQDLQTIIGSLIKGASKVHQVVKVPAIYEIHLQEEAPIQHEKGPLPQWQQPQASWNNFIPQYKKPLSYQYFNKRSPGMRYTTATWNLPPKIQYFNTKPLLGERNGKYSRPRPFARNKWQNSVPFEYWNNAKSVQVPISPGSTSVTFKELKGYAQNTAGTPDLSLYYAKKREIAAKEISARNDAGSNRRLKGRSSNSGLGNKSDRKAYQKSFAAPFEGMNYVIYVREKRRNLFD